jgi:transposase-like protein/DDE family transposase
MQISDEVRGADLGDPRRSRRLIQIVEQLAPMPDASFPTAAESNAALEATYRFLGSEAISPAQILAPHIEQTVNRVEQAKRVIVAHDTTELRYSGERDGLGRLTESGYGFFAHCALAVTADGQREPLGIMGLQILSRTAAVSSKRRRPPEAHNEARRWLELAHAVGKRLSGHAEVIHVMDSEADSFALFASLMSVGERFVIRGKWDRRISVSMPGCFRLKEKLGLAEAILEREVPLSARPKTRSEKDAKTHPARKARIAKLSFSAVRVTLRNAKTESSQQAPDLLPLNVVYVREVDTPTGEQPVEWTLHTTEPIETPEQIAAIVDAYRTRWVIEEFFKALKTGCAIEKRQLETPHALMNALAVFVPIAWQLLRLRTLARDEASRPASDLLSPLRLRLLQAHRNARLSPSATVRDALLAIARIGGHIKNNGEPGWQVIGRGFEKLLLLELGALLALKCDQS